MPKISSRTILCAQMIGRMEEFDTYGALRTVKYGHVNPVTGGTVKCGPWHSGQLSGADHDAFRADMGKIVYAVFSYSTPIAWVTTDGRVHKVAQKFSVTTSKHQGRLYLLGA